MIISFYDKNFKGLQDNASLVIENDSYSLIKRGVELDELKCTCEPFTEDIQPTFLIVKNDLGKYVYSCLAGIPERTDENKTVINGTDLKSMLKSDAILNIASHSTVLNLLAEVFWQWKTQVLQGSFNCKLVFDNIGGIQLSNLTHSGKSGVYDVWADIFSPYLRYYGLYMTSRIDLVAKRVIFTIGKSMYRTLNIRLWEHGIYNYGKWVADVNECQGAVYVKDTNSYDMGIKWILTSQNAVTTNTALRDIYPIKRRIVLKEIESGDTAEAKAEANIEALELLCESLYGENIELSGVNADFETRFKIYVRRGVYYKDLPCGELRYDANGLKSVQIGYRFTGLQFLI